MWKNWIREPPTKEKNMTTLTNVLQVPGRSRSRHNSHSFPTMMALDEEETNHSPTATCDDEDTPQTDEIDTNLSKAKMTDLRKYSDSILSSPKYSDMPVKQSKKVKASRRSSLGLGLLMGSNKNDSNKNGGKRRSSIAAILGRRNSKVC